MRKIRVGWAILSVSALLAASCATPQAKTPQTATPPAATPSKLPMKVTAFPAGYTPPPLPHEMTFPSAKVIKLTDRGAKTDGYTYCSDIIKTAIDELAAAGGGIVEFPKGDYLTGPIRMKSNITLQVDEGATIYFSEDRGDYPLVKTRYEGTDIINFSPLIYAYQVENIRITGKGTLNGAGQTWWRWANPGFGQRGRGAPPAPTEEEAAAAEAAAATAPAVSTTSPATGPAAAQGGRGGAPGWRGVIAQYINDREGKFPLDQRVFGDKNPGARPCFIEPYDCKNVLIEGVTLHASPFWNIHPVYSSNIIVRGVKVFGDGGGNTDGCDPDSCKNVLIDACTFTTGDDCIAIKSGKDGDGIRKNTTCENITIRDCIMNGGHGAVTMGSETSAGILHVFAENCQVKGPDSAIRLKTSRTRGGGIEDVYVRNFNIDLTKKVAITIDMMYGWDAKKYGPVPDADKKESTPVIKDIRIENLSSGASPQSITVRGLKESHVVNLILKDVSIKAQNGATMEFVDNFVRNNVKVNPAKGDAWTINNVTEGN